MLINIKLLETNKECIISIKGGLGCFKNACGVFETPTPNF